MAAPRDGAQAEQGSAAIRSRADQFLIIRAGGFKLIGAQARDMVALSIMILPEMLSHYRRLESVIDAGNERAVELVKLIGFKIEPAKIHEITGRLCHRVWVDSDETELPLDEPPSTRLLN